jgi:16S rRNA (cytidine1402-2'-O)-methyltransferase
MSTLFLVATPIGNLEDTSARAIRTLKEVRLVAAEDTRHTGKLLRHFEISTPVTSYYDHNKGQKLQTVLDVLSAGDVALVSDAGTPGLNDPGYLLVRAALEAGHKISIIPGPSAPIAALVISGLPTDKFLYLGYLPRKSGERQKAIEEVCQHPYTLIFFETPHRMEDALQDLEEILGNRQIAVAGELTKMYEEVFRGTINQAREYLSTHPARGEYTLVIAGQSRSAGRWDEAQLEAALQAERDSDLPPSQLARKLAEESGWARREVYARLNQLKKNE